jgi:hypothetical protein
MRACPSREMEDLFAQKLKEVLREAIDEALCKTMTDL